MSFRLIALHYAGEPRYRARYNEGITISAILELLKRRGRFGLLGTTGVTMSLGAVAVPWPTR